MRYKWLICLFIFMILTVSGCGRSSTSGSTAPNDTIQDREYEELEVGDYDYSEPIVSDLSGESQVCEVFSAESGNTYTLDVDFEGDQAIINFPNGGYRYVDIDDPSSSDFQAIEYTDDEGCAWEIAAAEPEAIPQRVEPGCISDQAQHVRAYQLRS